MIFEIPKEDILKGLINQLTSFFSISNSEINTINSLAETVFKRCEFSFLKNKNKYYSKDSVGYFNPYHSGQYTVFLYYYSNSVFKAGSDNARLADKIYYLNKIMNACDLFYEVDLPEIFMLDHPLGSVMGRAKFGNYFAFSQNCTVGNNNNIFPEIGEYVTMTANSMILGNSKIGDNVIIGAGACVKDQDVPDNSLVFGSSPNLIIKKRS
ncbi:transferase [Patiriisocius sp. Uisw_017]|jgi:serine O-acetyltransferase|uniref:transferase n=1 Tax=Patiriisocius sp. Uisw_017 TaxID=3230968 RepID=UPI0039E7D7B7